ncbi:MAG: MaoC family dehydratase N-terminal domain-containing protein [Myxococcales bacterium]|nr:MaoC family dehydratase N-terminal domain-containing protein [Myxococcales bacterium]
MLDRNAVGRTTPPTLHEVEKGAIRRFAEALGDVNPLYFDHEYARASGFSTVTVPPAFPVTFTAGLELKDLLGMPTRNLLLAEQTIDYERPIVAGDSLLVTSRVSEIAERPSPAGKVEVAVVDDEGRDQEGKVVYRSRRTFVVRGGRD